MRSGLPVALDIAFTAVVAGCTLIATFDDVPDASLGIDETDSGFGSSSGTTSSSSSSSGSSTTSSSSSSSSSSSGGTKPDAGTCDTSMNAQINCGGFTVPVCGNQLTTKPAGVGANDLVECDQNGNPTCVTHCATGCVDLQARNINLPSQCADCGHQTITPTQWYCGKNTSWVPDDSDIAYECTNGQYVADTAANCGKTLCHTTCTRTNAPKLPGSCCQNTPDN